MAHAAWRTRPGRITHVGVRYRCAISVCDIGVWQAGRVQAGLQAGVRVDIDFGVRDYVDRDVGSSYRTVPVYSGIFL